MTLRRTTCLLLALVWVTAPASEPTSHNGGLASSVLAKRLKQYLSGPDDDYRLGVRITSRWNNGRRSVVRLSVQHRQLRNGTSFQYRVKFAGNVRDYCLACGNAKRQSTCKGKSISNIPSLNQRLPETLLPWSELVLGVCGDWKIRTPKTSNGADPSTKMFEILPAGADHNHQNAWTRTMAYLDRTSGRPLRFERLDTQGKKVSTVRILETARFGGKLGVRRASMEFPEGKVLLEVRSAQLGSAALTPVLE